MHCLITHYDAEGLTMVLASLPTQAHLRLQCSTLRQVPKSNGFIPLICYFVTGKSSLFDLNYAKIIIRLQFCINDIVHI